MVDKVQKIREEVARIQLYAQSEVLKQVLDYIDKVQEESVSEKKCMFTKDSYTDEDRKVLCDGCEEECKFNKKEEPVSEDLEEEIDNYVKRNGYDGLDSIEEVKYIANHFAKWQKLKDMGITNNAKGVVTNILNSSDKSLDIYATEVAFIMLPANLTENYHMTNRDRISDAVRLGANWQKQKDSIVSEELEKAEKEWLTPQLDKSYANYGETKMMELTRFDGYAMLDAIEFGAKWQKKKTLKESEDAIQYVRENHSPSEVSDFQNAMNIAVMKAFDAGKEKMREQMMKNAVNGLVYAQRTNGEVMFRSNYVRKEGFEFGDKVKLIIIKEG